MSAVENILYIAMLVIILGLMLVIIILGLTGSGQKKIKHKLITANGNENRKRHGYRFAKRFFDIFMSLIAVICFSPMMLFIAIILKCRAIKPIFIHHSCIGRGGKKVYYATFNTINRSSQLVRMITATRIDAFPMFVSVLRGDLTLIGISIIKYNEVPNERKLMYQYEKPGLVSVGSLFKISGKTDEDVDKMYLKTRSIILDSNIMFYLIKQVLVTPME